MDGNALPGWALAGGAVTLLAVALEFAGNVWGISPTSSYPGWLTPIAWPTVVRVGWWLLAAVGTVAVNRGLARMTGQPRILRTVAVAVPFVAFAAGIAVGAEWATWH